MRHRMLMTFALALTATGSAHAATFAPTPIAPEAGVTAMTRALARQQLARDVFADPYATVVLVNTDVYDRFPYVESRRFEVVSDPKWDRLVCSEPGRSLAAFDGQGTSVGALAKPHGLAVDDRDRVYVADTGNDRIVVLQAVTEYDRISLVPLYAIPGLHAPYGVAWSDGGTPFEPADDVLYVADTGRNQVRAFTLGDASAQPAGVIGDLGSGDGGFAGPMAITVARENGRNTDVLYVADAHNRRIVRLGWSAGRFAWRGAAPVGADVVTALSTDEYGDVYAAAPQQGSVLKFNAALEKLGELHGDLARPRAVHVPYATTRDHRDGTTQRTGMPDAVTVEAWQDGSGVRAWALGVTLSDLAVQNASAPEARFVLSAHSAVSMDVVDAGDGRVVSSRALGAMTSGAHSVALQPADLAGVDASRDLVLRVRAQASGSDASDRAEVHFRSDGSGVDASRARLLGNWPNPVRTTTRFSLIVPANAAPASFAIYDAAGRRVRGLSRAFTPGVNDVVWDGRDDRGREVAGGVYFSRLDCGSIHESRRVAVVR